MLFKKFTKWILVTLNVIGLMVWWKMHYSTIYCTQLINFILILIFNWFFSNAQFLFSTSIYMFDRSCTRFHDKILRKSGATFSLCRVERFYYIRSSMVRKYKKNKDLKRYGFAANVAYYAMQIYEYQWPRMDRKCCLIIIIDISHSIGKSSFWHPHPKIV